MTLDDTLERIVHEYNRKPTTLRGRLRRAVYVWFAGALTCAAMLLGGMALVCCAMFFACALALPIVFIAAFVAALL